MCHLLGLRLTTHFFAPILQPFCLGAVFPKGSNSVTAQQEITSSKYAMRHRAVAYNVKLAQRFVRLKPSIQLSPRGGKGDRPLSLWERVWVRVARKRDNQRLGCGRLQPSRMASCFTQRIEERETGMACFITGGGIFAMPVRRCFASSPFLCAAPLTTRAWQVTPPPARSPCSNTPHIVFARASRHRC